MDELKKKKLETSRRFISEVMTRRIVMAKIQIDLGGSKHKHDDKGDT